MHQRGPVRFRVAGLVLNKWPKPFYSFEHGDKLDVSSSADEHWSDNRSISLCGQNSILLSQFLALEMVNDIPVLFIRFSRVTIVDGANIIHNVHGCVSYGFWMLISSVFLLCMNLSSAYAAEYCNEGEGLGIVRAPYILGNTI